MPRALCSELSPHRSWEHSRTVTAVRTPPFPEPFDASPLAAQGKVKTEAKGKVTIPDLSEETFEDLEMTVACDDENSEKKPLKEAMRTTGAKRIREACIAWVAELKKNVYAGDASAMVSRKPPTERVNNQYVVSGSESKKVSQIKISYNFNPPPQVRIDRPFRMSCFVLMHIRDLYRRYSMILCSTQTA